VLFNNSNAAILNAAFESAWSTCPQLTHLNSFPFRLPITPHLRSVSGKAHDFSRGMKANDATNINIIIHIPKTKST